MRFSFASSCRHAHKFWHKSAGAASRRKRHLNFQAVGAWYWWQWRLGRAPRAITTTSTITTTHASKTSSLSVNSDMVVGTVWKWALLGLLVATLAAWRWGNILHYNPCINRNKCNKKVLPPLPPSNEVWGGGGHYHQTNIGKLWYISRYSRRGTYHKQDHHAVIYILQCFSVIKVLSQVN